jgi:hypothetical protein
MQEPQHDKSNRRKKLWVAIILFSTLILVGASSFVLISQIQNKKTDTNPILQIDANTLFYSYFNDFSKSNEKFTNKYILVKGEIDRIVSLTDKSTLICLKIDGHPSRVTCLFKPEKAEVLKKFLEGTIIEIVGKCNGMKMDVELTNCILPEKQ